jgi:hypothetical protein
MAVRATAGDDTGDSGGTGACSDMAHREQLSKTFSLL